MYSQNIQDKIKIVCKFASKDETRHHLSHAIYLKEQSGLVACDGHRLIVFKESPIIDKPFNASVYLKTSVLSYADNNINYPNVKSIMPDLSKYSRESITLVVPEWLAKLEKHNKPIRLCFSANQIAITMLENPLFYLDARLLAPLVGLELKLSYKLGDDSKIAPVYFISSDKEFEGLIMPIRA